MFGGDGECTTIRRLCFPDAPGGHIRARFRQRRLGRPWIQTSGLLNQRLRRALVTRGAPGLAEREKVVCGGLSVLLEPGQSADRGGVLSERDVR
jgi:hypothetical protein